MATRRKTEHTIWKSIKNWAENWCQIVCGILSDLICCMTSNALAFLAQYQRVLFQTSVQAPKSEPTVHQANVNMSASRGVPANHLQQSLYVKLKSGHTSSSGSSSAATTTTTSGGRKGGGGPNANNSTDSSVEGTSGVQQVWPLTHFLFAFCKNPIFGTTKFCWTLNN